VQFTVTIVVTLALAIAANAVVYAVVDSALLHPLPGVADPSRLFEIVMTPLSYPVFQDYRMGDSAVAELAGFHTRHLAVRSGETTQPSNVALATGNYFSVVGARAQRGRLFGTDDDAPGGASVAIVSDRFWRRELGADSRVIGRTLFVSDAPFTIVGITEPAFRGTQLVDVPDLWIPIAAWPRVRTSAFANLDLEREGWGWMTAIGRLRPGVTLDAAKMVVRATAAHEIRRYPKLTRLYSSLDMYPATQTVAGDAHVTAVRFAAILLGAVGMVLLIACINVAMLLLARLTERRSEMSIRLALGADHSRLLRQIVGETALLAGLAAAVALAITWISIRLLGGITLPGGIALADLHVQVRASVLFYTALLAGVAVLIAGVAPAMHAMKDVELATRSHRGLSSDIARSRFRDGLLIGEVALSLVLLIGASLFVRGLQRALAINLGFHADHLAVASTNTGLVRLDTAQAQTYYSEARRAVRALPGVLSVSWSVAIPLSDHDVLDATVDGYTPPTGQQREELTVDIVDPGYVATVGGSIVEGREFTDADRGAAGLVALVNETFVRHYWPHTNPIGRQITITNPATVVGVVRDIKVERLDEPPLPVAYFPLDQQPHWYLDRMHLLVRTARDPEASLSAIHQALRRVNPNVPVENLATFGTVLSAVLLPQRLLAEMLGIFSVIAIGVAVVGMYGVLAYLVSRRTKEIGIRLALGARQSAVIALVVGYNLRRVAIGIVAGIGGALLLAPAASSLLYGVSATDVWAYSTTPAILFCVGLAAAYVPARRAARVDPVEVLRGD